MKNAFKISLLLVCFLSINVYASKKFDFSFKEKNILNVLSEYSEKTGTQFIVSPAVRGKISIIFPEEVTKEQAFNALSTSLALNGYTTIKEGESLKVLPARVAQRSNLEIYDSLPPAQPERMITYIYKLKTRSAEEIFKNLRMLNSKDGETQVDAKSKSLIFTDWVTNIQRIHHLLAKLDK
ncbi:MAG: hypothetical protein KDD58_16030 [Bdellovibrionales bacterium]|nr:hypothetical protein [Bdellovibrionales bacterium]